MYRVVIYCPDRHILYDPAIADRDGVGGGLTARLRLAKDLAREGCKVTLIANLRNRETRHGVEYIPLDQTRNLDGDVIILNTTGGGFDLTPAIELKIQARLRIVWVNNTMRVRGLEDLLWNFIAAPSNFVRKVANTEWRVAGSRLLVIHNGVPRDPPQALTFARKRSPFRLIYTSHPSKGLSAAQRLLQQLRRQEPRFELHVFGGNRLWGEAEVPFELSEGVTWHGLVGQLELAEELRYAAFSIHLQEFEEPFGISLAEAMSAGCIVVASRVGAFPELIHDGIDGLLIDGNPNTPEVLEAVVRRIQGVVASPDMGDSIRTQAASRPFRGNTIAQAWIDIWSRILSADPESKDAAGQCRECGCEIYSAADGCHCVGCGMFSEL